MTLDGAPLRRAAGLQPQQRWSVPADGALEVQPLEAPPEPPPRAPAAPAPAPGAPGRRSWSSGSADSALSSEPEAAGLRVVLLGAPGAGKSTLAGIFAGVDGADSDCEVLAEDTYERTLVVDGESTTIILLDMWENKKAGPAPWCSTASSSRRRRPCSTTCRSCSRASCGRSASAGTARRRTSGGWPSRSGGRASPGRPGASGARSWPKTRAWPSSSSPSPATTSLCSRHPEPPRCPPRGHR
ncbi:GTP-binding protein GEM isoform X3 [Pipistrellus kuhlii]|uniref:GTP-binding protein GEM isoform X3 n=1 Tax=Pipistrellus kuhlii TaxID=59472 RepID=UPI001E273013|nr:GTP-binding protein GEM isoform X3 [Pipistrellus kuhlii]